MVYELRCCCVEINIPTKSTFNVVTSELRASSLKKRFDAILKDVYFIRIYFVCFLYQYLYPEPVLVSAFK